ncbi:MAG: helix-turn-helix transcriptional regulator [Eubacteriales bacterium]
MQVTYKKLWKMLIDKDLKKKELGQMAELSTYTLGKMKRGENVNVDTLAKICKALDCGFDDIMEMIDESI